MVKSSHQEKVVEKQDLKQRSKTKNEKYIHIIYVCMYPKLMYTTAAKIHFS